ncbi:MAG TPA: DUF5985 family protein [Bryobacteraceae bacterium]|nr:DUF5985 family protein [Bryobacteraceae bacterium]
MIPALELFLLGVFAALCLIAALCFFKFWRKTQDALFLIFALSFFIRALNDAGLASLPHPNEGTPWSYFVNIGSSLLIVAAIIGKNLGGKDG